MRFVLEYREPCLKMICKSLLILTIYRLSFHVMYVDMKKQGHEVMFYDATCFYVEK